MCCFKSTIVNHHKSEENRMIGYSALANSILSHTGCHNPRELVLCRFISTQYVVICNMKTIFERFSYTLDFLVLKWWLKA